MTITPGATTEEWAITAGSKVGVVTVGDTQVLIEPKVGIRNVMTMMTSGHTTETWLTDTFDYGIDVDLLTATIDLFLASLDRAMAQGIRHDYVAQRERLNRVRGRINIAAAVRRPGVMTTMTCDFDDYTADNGLNRLLLAAVRRCYQAPHLAARTVQMLRRMESRFEEVGEAQDPLAWIASWTPSRLDEHFTEPVHLGAIILRNMSVAHRMGSVSASTFLVDMNRLVESFVTDSLKTQLPAPCTLSAQHYVAFDVAATVRSYPDIVILHDGQPALVADIKYKPATTFKKVSEADLYQVAAYAQALNVSRALLVLCGAGGEPAAITTRTSDIDIQLWPLDLTGDTRGVQEQVGRLASHVRLVARGWASRTIRA